MAAGGGESGPDTARRLHVRDLMRAAEDRPGDAILAGLDQVVETETDVAVPADSYRRDKVVCLRTLEAVRRAPPSGLSVDRRSTFARDGSGGIRTCPLAVFGELPIPFTWHSRPLGAESCPDSIN